MERNQIIYLTVYLIGYVWAYVLFKRDRVENSWTAVMLTISMSLFSWLMVINWYLDEVKLPKPPKWL